jgi:hypothetical protein
MIVASTCARCSCWTTASIPMSDFV